MENEKERIKESDERFKEKKRSVGKIL